MVNVPSIVTASSSTWISYSFFTSLMLLIAATTCCQFAYSPIHCPSSIPFWVTANSAFAIWICLPFCCSMNSFSSIAASWLSLSRSTAVTLNISTGNPLVRLVLNATCLSSASAVLSGSLIFTVQRLSSSACTGVPLTVRVSLKDFWITGVPAIRTP